MESLQLSLVTMRACWGRVTPKPSLTGVPTRRGEETQKQGCFRERRHGTAHRAWNDGAVSQGMPKLGDSPQKLGRDKSFSPRTSEGGAQPCHHLDSKLLNSRTVRKHISIVLIHPVSGN